MKNLIAKLLIVAITIVSFTFTSCKKEDVAPVVDNKTLLVDTKWKLTTFTVAGQDAFSSLAKCSQDDITIFKADGKVIIDQGVTKCDPADDQQGEDGTWTLSADGKVITHNDSFGDKLTKNILEISSTKLKIEYKELGVTWSETFTKI